MGVGQVRVKKEAIIHKIFEANSSFHVKKHATVKIQFLLKILFMEEEWALAKNSIKNFPGIS